VTIVKPDSRTTLTPRADWQIAHGTLFALDATIYIILVRSA